MIGITIQTVRCQKFGDIAEEVLIGDQVAGRIDAKIIPTADYTGSENVFEFSPAEAFEDAFPSPSKRDPNKLVYGKTIINADREALMAEVSAKLRAFVTAA